MITLLRLRLRGENTLIESVRKHITYRLSRYRSDNQMSSLSDNHYYPQFCASAADDDAVFQAFRSAPGYSEILEHVSRSLGQKYFRRISASPKLRSAAIDICRSDVVGSPRKFNYPGLGAASPTTLRYINVAADLEEHFGSLDRFRVVEIGVGYGGQCLVVCGLHNPQDYALVDLQPVLALTRRFLNETSPSAPVSFHGANEIPELHTDLLISNYAFSELRREIQDIYMTRLVDNARRGYMTFNHITPKSFRSISVKEFADRVGGKILPERPNSYPGNKIVVWGVKPR
jgi:putative sugar O-methyltransferase